MKNLIPSSARLPFVTLLAAACPVLSQHAAWAQELSLTPGKTKRDVTVVLAEAPAAGNASVRLEKVPVEVELSQSLHLAQNNNDLDNGPNRLLLLDDLKRQSNKFEHEVWTHPKAKTGWAASGRTLVVPAADPDAKMLAESEEDLDVMARLLEKAMNISKDSGSIKAAGIDLIFSSGSPSAVRNLYLAGHGALFVFTSPIPLKPEDAKEEGKKKESANTSAWDEARRELYRGPEEKWSLLNGEPRRSRAPRESYDQKEVERLQSSLIETLKEASNMRHVRPTETISVILNRDDRRSGPMAFARHVVGQTAGVRFATADEGSDQDSGATMLIRVTKANVDALAAGSMTLEQFKEKALILLY